MIKLLFRIFCSYAVLGALSGGAAFAQQCSGTIAADEAQRAEDARYAAQTGDDFTTLAGLIGAAVTHLCNRLAPGEDAEALARDTLEAALTGLRTGFAFTFRTTACGESSELASARTAEKAR